MPVNTGAGAERSTDSSHEELKRKLDEALNDAKSQRHERHALKKENKALAAEIERLKQAIVAAGTEADGPPVKRVKHGSNELVRRAGKMCTASVTLFPLPAIRAVFKSKLGSAQEGSDEDDDEDTNNALALAAARQAAAANLPPEYKDTAFVEAHAQQMIDALPPSVAKLMQKPWFAAEHAHGRRDQATTTMHKLKSKLIEIFGAEVGGLLATRHPSEFPDIPQIAALLENDSFLDAAPSPKPNETLLDRVFRGKTLIHVLWLICNGPSSIKHEGLRDSRAGSTNSELWDLKSVTKGLVGFGATALYCVLRGADPFSPSAKDGRGCHIGLLDFYIAKVKDLEFMEKNKPAKYNALMSYLNKTILPQYHAAEIVSLPPVRPADLALRAAMSAPSPPPPDASAKWACMVFRQHADLAEDPDGNMVPCVVFTAEEDELHPFRFIEGVIISSLGVLDAFVLLQPAELSNTAVYLPSPARSDIRLDSNQWNVIAAREPVRRYNVQWTLDLMRNAIHDPDANIPQDEVLPELDQITVYNMDLWDRRADLNGDTSRKPLDGDSLVWAFLTGPIIPPSDRFLSAADAPPPLCEFFSTLQHFYRVTLKGMSTITDIQYCLHNANDGAVHIEIVNWCTHSCGVFDPNLRWLTDGGEVAYNRACAEHSCTPLCKSLKLDLEQPREDSE